MRKERILTGERPTGKLHIGHYAGSILNRVKLQHEYDTFIIIADIQALTTHFETPEILSRCVLDVALDNLSCGIDPEIATIFIQSTVPQIAELTILLSMLVSVNVLRHNPTIKTEAAQYGYSDLSYGFLGYPVSQAADITFCKADVVPVGEDQLPVVEVCRKIVRRFNSLYKPVLKEPTTLLGDCPRLKGIDGNSKMGKSLNNAIYLSDSVEIVNQKAMQAVTDPARIRISDKGNPDICNFFQYQSVFNKEQADNIYSMCKNAQIVCTVCKKEFAKKLNLTLDPIRNKRAYYERHLNIVRECLAYSSERAVVEGKKTMDEIKDAMFMNYSL
jgi:tryptophanyl-tRNA synthetase